MYLEAEDVLEMPLSLTHTHTHMHTTHTHTHTQSLTLSHTNTHKTSRAHSSDPYVVFMLGNQRKQSTTVEKNLNPMWKEVYIKASYTSS